MRETVSGLARAVALLFVTAGPASAQEPGAPAFLPPIRVLGDGQTT
jgi:hypothetical protein